MVTFYIRYYFFHYIYIHIQTINFKSVRMFSLRIVSSRTIKLAGYQSGKCSVQTTRFSAGCYSSVTFFETASRCYTTHHNVCLINNLALHIKIFKQKKISTDEKNVKYKGCENISTEPGNSQVNKLSVVRKIRN